MTADMDTSIADSIRHFLSCRACTQTLEHVFVDLGTMPPSNAYLNSSQDLSQEKSYPLKVFVCHHCWLVQTQDFVDKDEMFSAEYAYFSSVSKGWVAHAKHYCAMIIKRLALNSKSKVIEIASNDGYLLQNFVAEGIPCLGVEPTLATANVARELDIPVLSEFFTEEFAQVLQNENGPADLIIGNNVLAHVPDINDFVAGLKLALSVQGTITLEFPHLVELVEKNQFDTIYHEHFSYLSLSVVQQIFNAHGLTIYDVEQLSTHGGSLRIYASHENGGFNIKASVKELLAQELARGLLSLNYYQAFQAKVEQIKAQVRTFLITKKQQGKTVVGYGAAAKGNTLLNYAGISTEFLPVIFDAAPSKQGKLMPGSHIAIRHPDEIADYSPDYILILPWNIKDEVMQQLKEKLPLTIFVVAVPELIEQGS